MRQTQFISNDENRGPSINSLASPSAVAGIVRHSRPSGTESLRKVERCIAFMIENINRPLQVATLAAFANISSSHFFALFKQRTGCAPMDYFTRLRVRHACELLDSTSTRIKEVAAELGYDDQFYFSRIFKLVVRVAPKQYQALAPEAKEAVKEAVMPGIVPWQNRTPSSNDKTAPARATGRMSELRWGDGNLNLTGRNRYFESMENCYAKA